MKTIEDYPMLFARRETPFVADLQSKPMMVQGKPMSQGIWNLMITERDLNLWCGKPKIKPHRHWKVTDVKKYFGITGNGENLIKQFLALKEEVYRAMEEMQA